jgi:hypothetical protein
METGSRVSHAGARAQAAGLKFAGDAGCADPDAAASCLRDTPEETLLTTTKALRPGSQSQPITTVIFAQHPCAPWDTAGAAGP